MHLKNKKLENQHFKAPESCSICQQQFMASAELLNKVENSDPRTVFCELLRRGQILSTKSNASYVNTFCSPFKFQEKARYKIFKKHTLSDLNNIFARIKKTHHIIFVLTAQFLIRERSRK